MEICRHGNCQTLVPRSEGLMALPLIVTSVTRNVKVDFHAEVREKHDFLQDVLEKIVYEGLRCHEGMKNCGTCAHH